jgi:hypothetical protein
MRRIVLLVVMTGSLLLVRSPAHAARPSGSISPLHQLSATLLRVLENSASRAGHASVSSVHRETRTPRRDAPAPAGVDAGATRLPDSAFAPGVVNSSYDGVADDSVADGEPFRSDHSVTYETLNRLTGYYERADWAPSAGETVYFRYQSSIFASATAAQNAWQDGVTYTQQQSGQTSVDCAISATCRFIIYQSGSRGYVDSFIQVAQCLAETEADYSPAVLSTQQTQLASTVATMETTAASILANACQGGGGPPPPTATPTRISLPPTATPTPPSANLDFSLIALRIETDAKDDYDLTRPPLAQATVGTLVYINMYWILRQDAPGGVHPSYVLTGKLQGRQIFIQSYSGSLASYTADTYHVHNPQPVTLTKAGTYNFTWQITLGGRTQTASARIKVARVVKRIARVTFSFDRLSVLNTSGKATRSFSPGQSVILSATYTVHNVRGTTSVTISKTFQIKVNGKWKAASNSVTSQDTTNGQHFSRTSSPLSPTLTIPQLRIVLSITIGAHTQSKKVVIHIK